jgi:hypothetical protein
MRFGEIKAKQIKETHVKLPSFIDTAEENFMESMLAQRRHLKKLKIPLYPVRE